MFLSVPSRDILLLVGDNPQYFSLQTKQWDKYHESTTTRFPISSRSASHVLTEDEKYVIICKERDIYVLDVDNKQCYQNKEKLPGFRASYQAVLMNERHKVRMLIQAYVMSCRKGLHHRLPVEVSELILKIYGANTFVYLLDNKSDVHVKVNVQDILQPTSLTRL